MTNPHEARPPQIFFALLLVIGLASLSAGAQDQLGGITGTIKDPSSAAVPGVSVKAVNIATNLQVTAQTDSNGSFQIPHLPVGTYRVSFSKAGFETQNHTNVPVDGGRTTTVDGALKIGSVSTTVDVNAVPLMNQVDTTIGYVVDQLTIQNNAAGHGQLHATGDSEPGSPRRFSFRRRAPTRAWAIRRFSRTASATPATAFRSTASTPTTCSTAIPPAMWARTASC